MIEHEFQSEKFEELRKQAEELVKQKMGFSKQVSTNIFELIHEVQIYQAELEIQNDELQRAQQELTELQHEFESLYEFAPCGYLTINFKGMITRINLTGVTLLGGERSNILGTGFGTFIEPESEETYFKARRDVGKTGEKQTIDLELKRKKSAPLWVRADIQADRNPRGEVMQWRIVMVDATKRKQAEENVNQLNNTLEERVRECTVESKERADQLQQIALQLSDAEDHERRRIAGVLHDDFQQELVYVIIELDGLILNSKNKKVSQKLAFLKDLIGKNVEKMRQLAYEINPTSLLHYKLFKLLEMLTQEIKDRYGLDVKLQTQPGAEPESLSLASTLSRIVKELLINAAKHAEIDSVNLDVREEEGMIRICVEDLGKGFDYERGKSQQGKNAGFGLHNIEDRIAFLGGRVHIESAPGKGCSVTLMIPKENS